jgi:hypothetical protein
MFDWTLIIALSVLFLLSLGVNLFLWKKTSLFSSQLRQVEELVEQRDIELNKLRKNLSTRHGISAVHEIKMPASNPSGFYHAPNARAATQERDQKAGEQKGAPAAPAPKPMAKSGVKLNDDTVAEQAPARAEPEPVPLSATAELFSTPPPPPEAPPVPNAEVFPSSPEPSPAVSPGEEDEVMDVVHEEPPGSPVSGAPAEEISLFDSLSQTITLAPLEEMLLLSPEQQPPRVLLDFGRVMFLFDDQHEALENLLRKARANGISLAAKGVSADLRDELKNKHADLSLV